MNVPESQGDKDVWFESSTESQPHASTSLDTPNAGLSTERRPQLPLPPARRRRVKLPLILFILTCFSTFWVGANVWDPTSFVIQAAQEGTLLPIRRTLIAHWQDGLIYMACVLAILMTHEMGHFVTTLIHRIPASLPYFIPLPISPIGTMGAVIGMDGMRADRREIFDIGLAGPIAGLVIALPVMWVGIEKLDLTQQGIGPFALDLPLTVRMMMDYLQPKGYQPGQMIWFSQFNPYFMAGWVGLLITGLNMLPVSQLDGGHVLYTLFGKRAHWIARGVVVLAIAYTVYTAQYTWILMIALVLLMGTDHPPTRDDRVRIGGLRFALGMVSMLIPIFCFAPRLIVIPGQ